ncbi:MAG TPA: ABC transporter permease [Phycisphaerae bacterium]|jgi:ribose/xylose/arabinose/galactoside ABC-type transport system permease subunit
MTRASTPFATNAGLGARSARIVARLGPMVGLLCVWLLFAALKRGDFVAWHNQRLMLLQTAVVGTAAVGATLVIISGGIDLSVGSSIALGTMVVALLLKAGHAPLAAALGTVAAAALWGSAIGAMVIGHVGRVAAIVLGMLTVHWTWKAAGPLGATAAGIGVVAVIGAFNEFALKRLPLSPFIVTLGMWGALRGAAKGLGDNQPVYPEHAGWLNDLLTTSTSGIGRILPPGVWLLLGLALLMGGVLRYTKFGRHVFAIGSNEQTARLCGIHVERTKLLIYMIAVACAGLAALLQFSFLSMGDPTTADGYELKVIAAVVIGGASLSGGEGSILGTIVGALIMTIVDNGCTKLGMQNWVQEIVTGGIIVTAVALDRWRHRRAE